MRRMLFGVAVVVIIVGLPAWATAGVPVERIAYSDAYGGSGLYTAMPDGTDVVHIAGTKGAYRPVWSPDGSGIAFLSVSGGIRWVDADGSNGHPIVAPADLPEQWPRVGGFAWSPDGSQLVVQLMTKDYWPSRLFILTVADGSFTPILRRGGQPDWASTGRIVAAQGGRLVTLDPDGSNLVEVLDRNGNSNPRWSPDGSRIVFLRTVKGVYDVFVVDADGANRANLTRSKQVDWSPTWSPDGTTILWSRSTEQFTYANLFTMLADGSDRTRLTATESIDEYEPDWTQS